MDIEVQNMVEESSKISFEVQKRTFERFSKAKMTLKIFLNIPVSFRLDFIQFSYYFKGKISENR